MDSNLVVPEQLRTKVDPEGVQNLVELKGWGLDRLGGQEPV